VLILVGATAAEALLTVLPLALLDDPRHAAAGGLAAVLCLIPAVGTLVLAGVVGRNDPDTTTTVILAGIGFRFVGVTAGVFLLDGAVTAAGIGRERFAGWAVFFYLMTLTAESILILRPDPSPPADVP
jgi:hypothetical protein